MNGIALMVEEHVNIKRVLKVVRVICQKIYLHEDVDFNDFDLIIDFIKEYADKHHHGKEEQLLFNRIVEETGDLGEKLITNGMMVEHFQGRFFIHELEQALKNVREGDDEFIIEIIANAISYVNLLDRHIDKEDAVVYPFAERKLKESTVIEINNACEAFENKQDLLNIQNKYYKIIEGLEKKYL